MNVVNERKFKSYIEAALALGGDYATGYQRGLHRHHHGDAFGTQLEHDLWLSLGTDGDTWHETGDGYRDGYAGRPPRGMHGNLGNQNAAKGEADSHLHIRVPSSKKAAYVKAAQASGMNLSEWVIDRLDDAAARRDNVSTKTQ